MTLPAVPEPVLWTGFVLLILVLLAVDLRASSKHPEGMTMDRAIKWSVFWVALSCVFGLGVYLARGGDYAAQFFTGYLLEKTLSVDNLFVFLLVFKQLKVPAALQHRVLSWGIIGALILRAIMIVAGIQLLHLWHPVIYVFGGFLVLTGLKTLMDKGDEAEEDINDTRLMRLARRIVPFVPRYDGDKFFTVEKGKRIGTMLLLVLLVIEGTDVIFAVDSIPAILAVTDDTFIVFSSNILAILGLRALFFTVAELLARLKYLKHGLGFILILIGAKMCLSDFVKVPPLISFGMTVGILALTVVASLVATRKS